MNRGSFVGQLLPLFIENIDDARDNFISTMKLFNYKICKNSSYSGFKILARAQGSVTRSGSPPKKWSPLPNFGGRKYSNLCTSSAFLWALNRKQYKIKAETYLII